MKKSIVFIILVTAFAITFNSCKKEETKTPDPTPSEKTLVGDWTLKEYRINAHNAMQDRIECQHDNIFRFTKDKSSEDEGNNKCPEQPQVSDYGSYVLTTDSIQIENFINAGNKTWQIMEYTVDKFEIQYSNNGTSFIRIVLVKKQ